MSTANFTPGMVLSDDVETFRGQLLLPTGTILSEKHIEKLMAWGISEAEIEGHADPTLEELEESMADAPDLSAASADLDRRFADVKDDALMQEILKIAKRQLRAKQA